MPETARVEPEPRRVPPQSLANLRPAWSADTAPRGGPGGAVSSGVYHEARRMAAQHTPEAMARMVELMRSQDERIALIACESIINRGAGKPRDHSNDERTTRADLSMLSPEQRRQLAELLMRALGQTGDVIDAAPTTAP